VAGSLISAQHLAKRFGTTQAVDDVSLEIGGGEIYGLVGPDGAGKTTTLRLICGVFRPDSGSVRLAGFNLATQVELGRQQIGYLAQRFALYEELTVLENLRFFADVRGIAASDWLPRSQEILEFVDLAEFKHRRAGQLSGGMKQKLGLALALVNRPRILLLDEPTTGVDPVTRQDFWRLIIQLLQVEKPAVLLCTPYMDEAARCSRVGFMREGKIICEGTPRQLRARLAGRILELAGEPRENLAVLASSEEHVERVHRFGNLLHLQVQEGTSGQVLEELSAKISASGCRLDHLRIIEPLLEDVFIDLSKTNL
jgi:ABC-2 type transport system ATP-binding protein